MFIDRNHRTSPARSEERNASEHGLFKLHSAPPNGAAWVELRRYRHLTPNGVESLQDGTTTNQLTPLASTFAPNLSGRRLSLVEVLLCE